MAERRDPKKIIEGYDRAAAKQTNFVQIWRDCYRLTQPMRDTIDNPQPGEERGLDIFDSTGVISTHRCANRMQAALFPIGQPFVALETGPTFPANLKDQAAVILEQVSSLLHAALETSNFATSIGEFLGDLLIGTGTMLVNKGTRDNPLQFVAVPPWQVALENGPWGAVWGVYRCHKDIKADQVSYYWPKAKMPAGWAEKVRTNEALTITVIEYCYFEPKDGNWYYDIVLKDEGPEHLLPRPNRYRLANPWIVTRWSKAANEVHGRGPVMQALADIRTVNKAKELTLMSGSLAISGVYTVVDDGVINPQTAVFAPGSMIPVARNQGHPMGASIMPLERTGDFDVAALLLEDTRISIKQALMDESLPPLAGPVRSATEIVERIRALQLDIGPAFGRIMNELIQPLVQRCLVILSELALLPNDIKIDGQSIRVKVLSPIARAEAMREVENVVQALTLAGFLGPQAAAASYKVEDIPAWVGRQLGVPEELIRDEGERATFEQQVAQTAQALVEQMNAPAQPAPEPVAAQ